MIMCWAEFLNRTQKAQTIIEKMTVDFIKIKNFGSLKDAEQEVKKARQTRRKYLQDMRQRTCVQNVYTTVINSIMRKTTNG